MALAGEVGLQLLLCPLSSNIVVRTACCSVGIVLPVYSTFKAIEGGDESEQNRWLLYWAAYGSFSLAEMLTDKLLFWFPAYYYLKFAFLVWLQLPSVDGAKYLYSQYLRPFMLNNQARLDHIVEFIYGEMVVSTYNVIDSDAILDFLLNWPTKFVSAHQYEFLLARKFLPVLWPQIDRCYTTLPARLSHKHTGLSKNPRIKQETHTRHMEIERFSAPILADILTGLNFSYREVWLTS